jgi:5-methyltetrahydropteroyltriglutamate--homocysteine methyltransferase
VDVGVLTTTAGSFPRSRRLRLARWRFAEDEIEADALSRVEAEATRSVLEQQRELGLDHLLDAQMDRSDMIAGFGEQLDGVEAGGLVRCYGNRYYRKPIVVGDIVRTEPMTVASWERARAMVEQPLRAIVTGPYTLMDWSSDEHYASREACCLAFAAAIRAEVDDLLRAGATAIQIDEPAVATREDEMDLVEQALSQVVAGVGGQAQTWVRLCYGNYAPVMQRVLDLPVDGVMLDLGNASVGLLDSLGGLPDDKLLCAGVVDAASARVETADEIRARIKRVAAKVPVERLWVAPDAGLRALGEENARQKLVAMVEAASSFSGNR